MTHRNLLDALLKSAEPSVRWKARVHVLGEDRDSPAIRKLEAEIKASPRAKTMLAQLSVKNPKKPISPYAKWQGSHWVLQTLADIGYPRGDKSLLPLVDQLLKVWLQPRFFNEFVVTKKLDAYKRRDAVPLMEGRHRTCASQQGTSLFIVLAHGFDDERIHQLAERLLYWQWPDGGWNCDKEPSADTSTFIHTLWSIRGLDLYAKRTGDKKVKEAIKRAVEVLLSRRLYKRISDGRMIREEFVKLHYPLYWHYDILGALKIFAEIGMAKEPRLQDALALLREKELPGGGWAAESRYYTKVSNQISLSSDYVDWGGTSTKKMNEWVTVDALYVMKEIGGEKF